ncbi:hypothetical protein J1N35_022376 [Gossypium stocksii]|uniref:Uncharacterized protein n=1 Tax=Gossypium stocksii TaxID=47602 RepID=A0A9D4A2X1_9ROSI|nr:hypothetical protein J1N35_022376 [Gossypium stocksii]
MESFVSNVVISLAGVEPIEDPVPLSEEHEAQEPCMVVPISYVDSQSTIREIDINLNAAPKTDVVGDDLYNSNDPSDREIDDECVNNDGNVNVSSVRNQICRIVIHNNPWAHMSRIDPDATHAAEFPKNPEILPTHRLAVDSDPEELFVGQRFESKEEYIFFIKRYSMNISVDNKVII